MPDLLAFHLLRVQRFFFVPRVLPQYRQKCMKVVLAHKYYFFLLSPTKGCQSSKLLTIAKKGQDVKKNDTSKQVLLF